jgi:hypothetical protein
VIKDRLTRNEKKEPFERFIPTLCSPDRDKSCFACCPPIRQAGYEHIQHRKIIERILRENTRAFNIRGKKVAPITGFSCWALGYLDTNHRLVGCLLHPAMNNNEELRYLVDYGEKCARETCQEAEIFRSLSAENRRFLISLTKDLDSFSYSSREHNPLFNILGWGKGILTELFNNSDGKVFDQDSFFDKFPFLTTCFNPKAHSYIVSRMVGIQGSGILTKRTVREKFERFVPSLLKKLRSVRSFNPQDPYVHKLDLDRGFLDFLRLSVGVSRISEKKAGSLKTVTDGAIKEFCSRL